MPFRKFKPRIYFYYYTAEELNEFSEGSEKAKQFKWRNVNYDTEKQMWTKDGKIIVPKEAIEKILTAVYNDPETGLVGRDKFWARIYEYYAGIKKSDVAKFLKNNETHQLHQIPKKEKSVKSIVISKPRKYLQCDLIDVSKVRNFNEDFTFIFTCVDLFSKYAWAVPLKDKTPGECTRAIETILSEMPFGEVPSVVQSDSGNEFRGEFDAYLEDHDIKHLTSKAYSPTSQGAVESFNKTLKLMIQRFNTNESDTKFYVDVLPLLLKNYNNAKHSTTGIAPMKLHKLRVDEGASEEDQKLHKQAFDKIKGQAEEHSTGAKFTKLKIGSYVRVLRTRHENYEDKPGVMQKKTIKQWSEEYYKVVHEVNDTYQLMEMSTEPFKDDQEPNKDGLYYGKLTKYFKRDHLLDIPNPSKMIKSKGERGDYSERSGTGKHNIQQLNRKANKKQKELATTTEDEFVGVQNDDLDPSLNKPIAKRKTQRVIKKPKRYQESDEE